MKNREIKTEQITEVVAMLCKGAAVDLPTDVEESIAKAYENEDSEMARDVLAQILENAKVARAEGLPLCQDTGYTVVYVELGQEAQVVGGELSQAIQDGVRNGYLGGHLRASVVEMPFGGRNTRDNTPAIIHYDIVPGTQMKITVLPKGMGCENTSRLKMVKPSEGWEGVLDFVVETVKQAGPNACPPLVVGVGIGGTFDYCAYLAKRAVMRRIGERNELAAIAELERQAEGRIAALLIGPQGLGGKTTALGVHMIVKPCHIASVPVAVNIQCHAARQRTAVI